MLRDNLMASAVNDTLNACVAPVREPLRMQGKVRLVVEKEYTLEQIRQVDFTPLPAHNMTLNIHLHDA